MNSEKQIGRLRDVFERAFIWPMAVVMVMLLTMFGRMFGSNGDGAATAASPEVRFKNFFR